MKKIVLFLLAGLSAASFALAADNYTTDNTTRDKEKSGSTYKNTSMTSEADHKRLGHARNYQGTWNENWSHPEWGYRHAIWGTASTLDVLSDPDSGYKTQATFKY